MIKEAKKIFIVDDNIDDLKTMKTLLKKQGYCTCVSTNGAETLTFLSKEKCEPNLILIDILMPTLSGYDLLRLLKDKVSNNVKIAYVSIVPKQEADLEGIDEFIQKPFSTKEFVRTVKKLVGK